jgi:AraC family transcriptional regulator
MAPEPGSFRVATQRGPLPPMTCADTFHWDGMGTVSRGIGSHTDAEPDPQDRPVARGLLHASCQTRLQTVTGRDGRPSATAGEMRLIPSSPPQTLNWAQEAVRLTVYLDPGLLARAGGGLAPTTGALVWARRERETEWLTLDVHPVLLVKAARDSRPRDRVELVPHLHADDPLLHHIRLVLQAAIDARSVEGRLYAESLTHALAAHLLRRCETCLLPAGMGPAGLSKPKLRRTTDYIEAHLAHECSVAELAAVTQTSPDHFTRLFREATGQTPHQYVILCRIARAKQLLTETASPIIEIGQQIGFTDQSYFTAVFRKHVATTPNAYRADTQP